MQPRVEPAAASRKSRKKLGFVERVAQGSIVVNRLVGDLNHRARFDIAPGADVVREAGRRRTECLALAVVVGVDDDDRLRGPHVDDELSRLRAVGRASGTVADSASGPTGR